MQFNFKKILNFSFLCLFLFISACGYTSKVILPYNVKSIYVPTFKNNIVLGGNSTYEAGIAVNLTNKVLDRLIYDGNLKVKNDNNADAILEGEIVSYRQEPLRYNSIEGIEQFRLILTVNLKLSKFPDNEIIWQENNFTVDTEYFIEGVNAKSESAALSELLEDMAKKIVNRIVEDW